MKHAEAFERIFGVPLEDYWDKLFGFEIVKFNDEVVVPPDGISIKDEVIKNHGEEAAILLEELISILPAAEMTRAEFKEALNES